jgi:TonB family protein
MFSSTPSPLTGATVLMGSAPAKNPATDVTFKAVPPPPTQRAPAPALTEKVPIARVAAAGQPEAAQEETREAAIPDPGTVPVAPTPRRPRGISTGVILALAGLLTLAAVGLGMVALYRRLSAPTGVAEAVPPPSTQAAAPVPTSEPTAVPAKTQGVVRVETEPPGAAVAVDGEAKGVTPLEVAGLALGNHDVTVELKGYEPKTESVALTSDSPQSQVKLALTRVAPTTGAADILSTPFGATVSVDGAAIGYTPLKNWKLKLGTHKVQIEKDGHEPWSGTVAVRPGKRAKLDVQLKAVPRPTPQPTAEAVDPSRIYEVGDIDVRPKKVSGEWAAAPKLKSGERISVGGTFVVTDGGEVTDVRITESAGKVLDESVAAAIRKWKYTPATKRGVKVKVRLPFKQTFTTG